VLSARLYDRALAGAERRALGSWRRELLQDLSGVVLEIGAGTGANLPFYGPSVDRLLLLEPDPTMRTALATRAASDRRCSVLAGTASELPLGDSTVDAVVSTLVLCSVRELDRALQELQRVLRPGGRLHVIEHVAAAPGSRLRRAQGLFASTWSRVGDGCSLVRPTPTLLAAAGFDVSNLRADALPVVVPLVRPVVRGSAWPRTQGDRR
jgi:ubiquinone/menaquinone biosynthesis C-methylase UbiE